MRHRAINLRASCMSRALTRAVPAVSLPSNSRCVSSTFCNCLNMGIFLTLDSLYSISPDNFICTQFRENPYIGTCLVIITEDGGEEFERNTYLFRHSAQMHLENPILLLQRTPWRWEGLSTLTQSPACKGTAALSQSPRHCSFLSCKPLPEVPLAMPWADCFPFLQPQPLCRDFISTWDWVLVFVCRFHHSDKTPEMINLMMGIFLVARGFRDLFGLSLLGCYCGTVWRVGGGDWCECSPHNGHKAKRVRNPISLSNTPPKDLTYLH